MQIDLDPSWQLKLQEEFEKTYFIKLRQFLKSEKGEVYPPSHQIFRALQLTPFDEVKVVILGQDPYHTPGMAEGLSFSVPKTAKLPPSLRHIFKELSSDLNLPFPSHGSLEHWARQGVLLLNVVLTVRAGVALSHQKRGWEEFTDAVLMKLLERKDPVIFVLWGGVAKRKLDKLVSLKHFPQHVFLTAPHPSPLSAYQGFFGCEHFSKINALLKEFGKKEIAW